MNDSNPRRKVLIVAAVFASLVALPLTLVAIVRPDFAFDKEYPRSAISMKGHPEDLVKEYGWVKASSQVMACGPTSSSMRVEGLCYVVHKSGKFTQCHWSTKVTVNSNAMGTTLSLE